MNPNYVGKKSNNNSNSNHPINELRNFNQIGKGVRV